jgi:hypothetical protein
MTNFFVQEIIDHEDGGATIVLDLDAEALKAFASIGIRHVLLEAAEKAIADGDVLEPAPQEDQVG